MTLGQKIKSARKSKKITQAALCSDKITRNMLSAIECDKAMPSLDTLKFIAAALNLPITYLLSSDDNLFFYQKMEMIPKIKENFANSRYKKCVELISALDGSDDEIAYILTICCFMLGRAAVLDGSLKSAAEYLERAKEQARLTVYNTDREEVLSELYLAIAKNIKTPMLELDQKKFEENTKKLCDSDFYKYILQDTSYIFSEKNFAKHLGAKELIKSMRIQEALVLMKEIESEKSQKNYNAYLILNLYNDMENCYKRLGDFENAYKYAVKRMTLIEEFKS